MKVNEIITGKFLEALKQDIIPWNKPWNSEFLRNAVTGKAYSGVNVLVLALLGNDSAFLTFKQAQGIGGNVKKCSKSLPVVFCAPYIKKDKENKEEKQALALRYYNVFSVKDCELPNDFKPKGQGERIAFEPIATCEELIAKQSLLLEHVGNRACYSPSEHKILMPEKETFKTVNQYYLTLFHEIIHREAKEIGEELSSSMEKESYSKEELVAEIGANFLANFCGLNIETTLDNSKAYVQGWIKQLESNPQLIISAASKAQKRFNNILKRAGHNLTEEKE